MSTEQLKRDVIHYLEADKKDSAYLVIANFRKQKNLGDKALYACELYYAELLYSVNRYKEAIEAFRKSGTYLTAGIDNRDQLLAMTEARIAGTYFTLQDFDSAFYYSSKAYPRLPPERMGYKGENREMTGYYYFIHGKYGMALNAYNEALSIYSRLNGVNCANSSVYNKLGLIYAKTKRYDEAVEMIWKAVKLSDSCGYDARVLSYISLTNVLKEAGRYQEALVYKDIVDSLNSLKTSQQQDEKVLELEARYQTKLREQENEALKKVNSEREEVVKQQQNVITISVITIVIFTGLLFFLIRAINQRNKINRELQLQKTQIEKVNKDLERLNLLHQKIFSVISHDFKGPVLTLELLLEAFRKQNSDTQLTSYINDISAQLNNANEILSNLLNWAKTEINIAVTENAATDLNQINTEITNQVKTQAGKKNITIKSRVPENISLHVPADIVRIVLRNLLTNAIKFSYRDSEINVEYDHQQNQLSISDKGTGMEAEKINKLFRQDVMPSFGTNNEAGFGMGLYIVAELLHKYKSSIAVRSQPGSGTTFMVSFPVN